MAEEKNVKKDRGRWFREMRSELKKVVWPAPDKVAKNTGSVFLSSVLIGACLWVFASAAPHPTPARRPPAARARRIADAGPRPQVR